MPIFDLISDTPRKRLLRPALFLALCAPLALAGCPGEEDPPPVDPEPRVPGGPTHNGLDVPDNYIDWPVLGVALRTGAENTTIRVITGNSTAVAAARAGETNPWPDGSGIADLVWSRGTNPDWADVIVHDEFAALAYMTKNAEEYADDGGWQYGIWSGAELQPSDNVEFDRDCVECHMRDAPDNDDMFTRIMPLPGLEVNAADGVNGVPAPVGWQDWAVLGVAQRTDNNTIRVITGNTIAVDAARAGDTNPWPEGSEIVDIVWPAGTNPDHADMIAPDTFGTMVYMVKDSALYGDRPGNWAYGAWTGADMTPNPDPGFEQLCIDCHVAEAEANDYVFTRMDSLPQLPAAQ